MASSIASTPASLARPAGSSIATLVAILVFGGAYIIQGTDPMRAEALVSVLCEFLLCVLLLGVVMARSPGGALRVSDPFLLFLGFGLNFLVLPSVAWLHGADYEQQWFEVGRIRIDIFVRLQWMHMLFLGSLSAVYFALAPQHSAPAEIARANRPLPNPWPWIVVGLAPLAFTVAERVITTGSIAAAHNYGDLWFRDQEQLTAVHQEGGSALAVTQLFSKVWFLPWQALGVGEGLLLAGLLRQKRRVALLLFALQLPIFTLLNSGGRSVIAIPFIAAVLVADLFAGPIRWRWVLAAAVLALSFFNIFGVYRAHRDRDFGEAVAITSEEYDRGPSSRGNSAEGDIMIIKEHYGVAWVDATDYVRGAAYFSEGILALLPQQIVPDKLRYMNTGYFLSRELLGPVADRGSGVAGAMIVDGYMIGREFGVMVLGLVLGLIAGGAVRLLASGRFGEAGRPRLWQTVVLLSTPALGITFYRNDFTGVLSTALTTLLLPAMLFAALVALAPQSPWGQPIGER